MKGFRPRVFANCVLCFLGMKLRLLGIAVQSLGTIPTLLSGFRLYICFPVGFHDLNRGKFILSRLK